MFDMTMMRFTNSIFSDNYNWKFSTKPNLTKNLLTYVSSTKSFFSIKK